MSLIIGSVLGDAYIYPKGKICFDHSEKQKEYLFWKFAELKAISYPKVSMVRRFDKRTGQYTQSWRFFLKQYFRVLRKSFYPSGKKIVPIQLVDKWFTPLSLAVWYMDDGYLDKGRYPLFMTESFPRENLEKLRSMIQTKLGISLLVTKNNRIRLLSKSSQRFFQLIGPHVHKDLSYKLP
ncbi:MAG: hypothetical protein ACOZAN_03385 [Patescibacteria group bacterium]